MPKKARPVTIDALRRGPPPRPGPRSSTRPSPPRAMKASPTATSIQP